MPTKRPTTTIDTKRCALYLRVSTDEQAEKGTIEVQRYALQRFALDRYTIAAEYADDGISGAYPLDDRPAGARLLADARAGRFDTVLIYSLTRLGRTVRNVLESEAIFSGLGVALRSVTEDFQTETPAGIAQFQMLAVFSEFERGTIRDRMMGGRDKAVRIGKWTNGPVPFGYALDLDHRLIPSDREVPGTGQTEAEVAAGIFENMANGATVVGECRRMNATNVPTTRRYANGKTVTVGKNWLPSRLHNMLHSSVYRGIQNFKSKNGPIEIEVPALVTDDIWHRAIAQLGKNRAMSSREGTRFYPLRGLIKCGTCGNTFVGYTVVNRSTKWEMGYYRCGAQLSATNPLPGDRCRSKNLPAKWIEDKVWADIRDFLENPGAALSEAAHQAKARANQSADMERERAILTGQIAEKTAERERVLTLARKGVIDLDEAAGQLEAMKNEADTLRTRLAALDSALNEAAGAEAKYADAEALLSRLAGRVQEIEAKNDIALKRRITEALVNSLVVTTEWDGNGRKVAHVQHNYALTTPDYAVESTMPKLSEDHYSVSIVRQSAVPALYRVAS